MTLRQVNILELEKCEWWKSYPDKNLKIDFLSWLSKNNFQVFTYISKKNAGKWFHFYLVKQGTYRPNQRKYLSGCSNIIDFFEGYDYSIKTDRSTYIKNLKSYLESTN